MLYTLKASFRKQILENSFTKENFSRLLKSYWESYYGVAIPYTGRFLFEILPSEMKDLQYVWIKFIFTDSIKSEMTRFIDYLHEMNCLDVVTSLTILDTVSYYEKQA